MIDAMIEMARLFYGTRHNKPLQSVCRSWRAREKPHRHTPKGGASDGKPDELT